MMAALRRQPKVRGSWVWARRRRARGGGRPSESNHPFPLALAANGTNIAEWAAKHRYPDATVRSWYRVIQTRPIPQLAAAAIEKEYGIPPTAWARGILVVGD